MNRLPPLILPVLLLTLLVGSHAYSADYSASPTPFEGYWSGGWMDGPKCDGSSWFHEFRNGNSRTWPENIISKEKAKFVPTNYLLEGKHFSVYQKFSKLDTRLNDVFIQYKILGPKKLEMTIERHYRGDTMIKNEVYDPHSGPNLWKCKKGFFGFNWTRD